MKKRLVGILSILVLCTALNGCAAALIGGGIAGGYYVAKHSL